MQRFTPSRSPCPVGRASRILGDRWVILILREALLGARKFEEFIPNTGINRAALTSRLAALCDFELLERVPPKGRRAEYVLTEAGRDLAPLLNEIGRWGSLWLSDEKESSQ